ncbi:hypothetical protein HU200_067541 [Digitaria exilis]|uniref:non-specific serine/threonine protein kinase n=1 Tax=Digitaria exilis TaxID=1010633 RepID=A0A835A5M6_9POAL|nr:hypothetical protein HU200_067541 [Digitaria exilis]CAB3489090.1 unnamed protein product [Digitaria exilis]
MRRVVGVPAIAAVVVTAVLYVASAALVVVGELTTQLQNGLTATHAASATSAFEPVLYAPNGVFAFGFLRVGDASLDLAVVHLPSSFPLWRATPARLGDWSRPATLTFDTTLVLTDEDSGVLWQTLNTVGDVVVLLNSSNLILRRYDDDSNVPPWQSFEHPSDTLVVDQNFTGSSPPLISNNRRFAFRLGKTFMALHMEFYGGKTTPMYWHHTALEAHPENATEPPVYGRLDVRGFFGLYLAGGEQKVDTLSFDTFLQNLTGEVFRRMTMDDDGNLRAYYWTDGAKDWISDYRAIAGDDRCELPTSCGAYGLCVPGGAQCQCLDNATSVTPPTCHAGEETTDLCSGDGTQQVEFDVVRRTRVSVAYKDELSPETNKTEAECEAACAGNCSCWGAVYNGASGYCYLIDFPVETMVYEADDRKVGYFKVRKLPSSKRSRMSPGVAATTAVLSLVLVVLVAAGAWFGYRLWERRWRGRAGTMEQELVPGRYKDLKSMGSSNDSFK